MVATRTIPAGVLTAADLEEDTGAPRHIPHQGSERINLGTMAEQMGIGVAREAFAQLSKPPEPGQRRGVLWLAVGFLGMLVVVQAAAFGMHVVGDGTVREEARTTKVLVVWLVRCEHARQRGEDPPQFPYEEM